MTTFESESLVKLFHQSDIFPVEVVGVSEPFDQISHVLESVLSVPGIAVFTKPGLRRHDDAVEGIANR